jgi:hypothetical protein
LRRLAVAAAACLAVVTLFAAPSLVAASPNATGGACTHGYSYAGYASRKGVRGIAASIAATRRPTVTSGHAAAWVGVGGVREALGRRSAWLQAGVAAFHGTGLRLYVEYVSLGRPRRFIDLGRATTRSSHRFEVLEIGADVWQAFVDRHPVGRPTYLPTGGGTWRGVATAESWTAGGARCNRFGYRFERVTVLGSGWRSLHDAAPVGRRAHRIGAGFEATA